MIWNCKMIMQSIQESCKHRGPIINIFTDSFKPPTGGQNPRRLVAPQKRPGLGGPSLACTPSHSVTTQVENPGKKPELHLASLIRIYKKRFIWKTQWPVWSCMHRYQIWNCRPHFNGTIHGIWHWESYQTAKVTSGNLMIFLTSEFTYILKHVIIEWNLVIFTVSSTLFSNIL
jgi:hypothetical protein